MKVNLYFFLLLFLCSGYVDAQSNQAKISCKVLDKDSKKPVVYATVMLKKINRGTHADFNGNFEIPIKYQETGIIKISSIGYQTKEIKLSNLKNDSINIIYLSTSNSALDEIVVKTPKRKRKLFAREIVRKAIDNILKNYPTSPHSYVAYYRDYQQPVDDSYKKSINATKDIQYLNVHEGIIESFDEGFKTDKLSNKNNQALLYNFKANNNFIQDSTLTIPYDNRQKKYSKSVYITPLGGNELNILNLTNAVRNYNKMSFSFTNVFSKDFIKNHFFKIEETIFSNDTPLYKINFYSLKDRTSYEYSAKGTIYISKKEFAIYKLNYNLFYRNKKSPQYAVTIEYTPNKDKMYLNYISFHNFFEATNGNYFKVDKTYFNSRENCFYISFNNPIQSNTIEPFRKNFKIYYKDQKLKVIAVQLLEANQRTVKVFVDELSLQKINFNEEKQNPNYGKYFTFELQNIKDYRGFEINKRPSIKLNQYRELFVQEIFTEKKLQVKVNFVDKSLPLSKSIITPKKFEDSYWINSPLKKSKN